MTALYTYKTKAGIVRANYKITTGNSHKNYYEQVLGDEGSLNVSENDRVSLGVKQLKADPWATVTDRYPVGSKTTGKVVSITDYGVFVEIEEGVEGLIHISEMTWSKKPRHPSKMVAVSMTAT